MAIETLRKHVTGLASKALIGLLALSFIAFYATTDIGIFKNWQVGDAAAKVNGEKIPEAQFRNRLQQNLARFQAYTGGEVPPQMQGLLVRQTLDQIIQSTLMTQAASDLGLRVSDIELAKAIMDIPDFQKNGKFDPELYHRFHQINNVEESIRGEILRAKYQQFLSTPFLFSEEDLKQEFSANQNEVTLDYLILNPDQITEKMTLSPTALADFKKKRQADIKAYFEKNPKEFSTEERLHARHILVRVENPNDDASVKKAFAQIQSIHQEALANPRNFADLAKRHSEDPGSKMAGGDLGFFPRGQMNPLFEEAAFKLKNGEIGDPIKTPFGYHIIKVEGRTPAVHRTLEQSESDIALKIFVKENKDTLARDVAQKINIALEKGGSIQSYLSNYKLSWNKDTKVSLKSQVFGTSENARQLRVAALALGPKTPTLPAPARVDGNYYILKFRSKKTADPKDFEKQKPILEGQLSYQYTNALQQNFTKYLQQRAKIIKNEKYEKMTEASEG